MEELKVRDKREMLAQSSGQTWFEPRVEPIDSTTFNRSMRGLDRQPMERQPNSPDYIVRAAIPKFIDNNWNLVLGT